MENKCYFIPKNLLQPDEYRLIFNSWNAVYKHSDSGKEYMIKVVPKLDEDWLLFPKGTNRETIWEWFEESVLQKT